MTDFVYSPELHSSEDVEKHLRSGSIVRCRKCKEPLKIVPSGIDCPACGDIVVRYNLGAPKGFWEQFKK